MPHPARKLILSVPKCDRFEKFAVFVLTVSQSWAGYTTGLCLTFLIWKMGVIIVQGSPPILGLITSGFDQAWTKKKNPKKTFKSKKFKFLYASCSWWTWRSPHSVPCFPQLCFNRPVISCFPFLNFGKICLPRMVPRNQAKSECV